ncbi:MAG: alpha/beta hydrolase-fold protein [Armatimonas sp.]
MKRTVLPLTVGLLALVAPIAHADLFTGFYDSQVMHRKMAGHLSKTKFPCPSTGGSRTVYLYTPQGYSQSAAKHYPVLVLLHGEPGQPVDWIYKGEALTSVEKAISAGTLPPCLVAIPDGGGEWADSVSGNSKMESAVVHDLSQFLLNGYHASPNPALWAVGGLSEGGFGAANMVIHHPERFQSALVISTELRVNPGWNDTNDVFGTDPKNRSYYSPIEQIRKVAAGERSKLHFYVAVGEDEGGDRVSDSVGFGNIARAEGATTVIAKDPGGHKWPFWTQHLRAALTPLAQWWKQAGA